MKLSDLKSELFWPDLKYFFFYLILNHCLIWELFQDIFKYLYDSGMNNLAKTSDFYFSSHYDLAKILLHATKMVHKVT